MSNLLTSLEDFCIPHCYVLQSRIHCILFYSMLSLQNFTHLTSLSSTNLLSFSYSVTFASIFYKIQSTTKLLLVESHCLSPLNSTKRFSFFYCFSTCPPWCKNDLIIFADSMKFPSGFCLYWRFWRLLFLLSFVCFTSCATTNPCNLHNDFHYSLCTLVVFV